MMSAAIGRPRWRVGSRSPALAQLPLDFDKLEYQARGVLYVPEAARFSNLLKLPEGANVGQAISDAMKAIEAENEDLKDVLPKTYNRLDNATLVELLRLLRVPSTSKATPSARSTSTSWASSP